MLTKKNIPDIMKYLLYYNNYLFVCDFDNRKYFWLNHKVSKKSQI